MSFWAKVLEILDARMTEPELYGWFHWMSLALTILVTIFMCWWGRKHGKRCVRRMILWTSLIVILLEIYKQINFSFEYAAGVVTFDYEWYAFPFQFCSTPMYVGVLAGLTRRGKFHDDLSAYLATYSIFAGVCVMLYPSTVFTETIGINIQTMVCHGVMIAMGVCMLYTRYVKSEHRTILQAIPVFAVGVVAAVLMNELANHVGLLENESFNMFQISPYCDPSLPVYSEVQKVMAFPWCLIVYVAIFSLAAYIILLISILCHKIGHQLSHRRIHSAMVKESHT